MVSHQAVEDLAMLRVEQKLDPQEEVEVPTVAVQFFTVPKSAKEMNQTLIAILGNSLTKKRN